MFFTDFVKGSSLTRFYSAVSTKATVVLRTDREVCKLDPWWVTGFIDGEGCFTVSIVKNKNLKHGWQVDPCFQISLHKKDKPVFEAIKKFLGVGHVTWHGPKAVQLRVQSLKELETVINHFQKFSLITKKRVDLKLLIMIVEKIKRKEHLTEDGLCKIVAIKGAMNLGLSDKLKLAFLDVVPVVRPKIEAPKTIDPNLLSGFASAEGCFLMRVTPSKTKVGFRVQLVFQLTQHVRDEKLLIRFISFFNCGNVVKYREVLDFRVYKLRDIEEKIIPFFKKHRIRGVKALDFEDWCKAAELMKEKKHLTAEGLEEIKQIKTGMNTGRKN